MSVKPLEDRLSYHAWNKDQSMICVSPNSSEVKIFETSKSTDPSSWKCQTTLTKHNGYVSGIDWSPVSNMIVTCGHDRNAYVWKQESDGKWEATLVILRINRAATSVKWSPAGNKFAVTSGSKLVPICHYEKANNWWISNQLKRFKSTVLSVDWCPNNKFVVCGSTDFKCRLFSAYIEGVDSEEDDGFGEVFKKQHVFGSVLAEFDQAKAWVNTVAWSPGGMRIAFSGHGSTMHFGQITADGTNIHTVQYNGLPFVKMSFLSDNTIVAVGYDNNPVIFANDGTDTDPKWKQVAKCDKEEKVEEKKKSAFGASRALFSAASSQGVKFGDKGKVNEALTKHKNTVTDLQVLGDPAKAKVFTTCGLDGRVFFWDLAKLGHVDLAACKLN